MALIYFASGDNDCDIPRQRASLTFLELRGMFGAYEPRYLSHDWSSSLASISAAPSVIAELTTRDGVHERFPRAGFYLLAGLSQVKVNELLKYRDSYNVRLAEADHWALMHKGLRPKRCPR